MGTFKVSHLKQIKTTILGLIFLAVAFYGVFKWESFNIWIFVVLIGTGILMLFSPDTLIASLIKFVKKNDEFEIGKDGDS